MLILLKCSYNAKMIAVEACGDCAYVIMKDEAWNHFSGLVVDAVGHHPTPYLPETLAPTDASFFSYSLSQVAASPTFNSWLRSGCKILSPCLNWTTWKSHLNSRVPWGID